MNGARRLFVNKGGLRDRAIRASGLSMLEVGGLHVLRLTSNLIMTRILVPEAFALMSLVSTVITAFGLLSDIGIHRSIVRESDGASPYFLRVAWVVKLIRGGLIASGVVICAIAFGLMGPSMPQGTVYADSRLPWLLLLSACVPIMLGAESTTKELAQRRLDLKWLTFVAIGAQVVSILAMIGFSLIQQSVWALMAGMLMANVVKTMASHLIIPGPRMQFVWDKDIAIRLWAFGKWLIGSSMFTFVARNGDRILLGGLANSTIFGVYAISRVWLDAGQQVVAKLSDQVGFASMGEVLRDRPDDAPQLFRKFQSAIDCLCVLGFAGLFFLGHFLISLLYTNTYEAAGSFLRILSLQLLAVRFESLYKLVVNLGHSRAMMVISALRAAALCAALPLGYAAFGMTGALFAVALSPLAAVPFALWVVKPFLGRQIIVDVVWACVILVTGGALMAVQAWG